MTELLIIIVLIAMAVAAARAGRPQALIWLGVMAALTVAGILIARADPGSTVLTWHPVAAVSCFGAAILAFIKAGTCVLSGKPELTAAIKKSLQKDE